MSAADQSGAGGQADLTPEAIYTGLMRRRLLMRLDSDGLECAAGRIWWSEVEHVGLVGHEQSDDWRKWVEEWFLVSLRSGARLLPPVLDYYDGGKKKPRRVATGLEVPVWTHSSQDLGTIRRFYAGPVSDKLELVVEPPVEMHPVPFTTVRESWAAEGRLKTARMMVPRRSLNPLRRGRRPASLKRLSERIRCVNCGRKPHDNENPEDAWMSYSDEVDGVYAFICPGCGAEPPAEA